MDNSLRRRVQRREKANGVGKGNRPYGLGWSVEKNLPPQPILHGRLVSQVVKLSEIVEMLKNNSSFGVNHETTYAVFSQRKDNLACHFRHSFLLSRSVLEMKFEFMFQQLGLLPQLQCEFVDVFVRSGVGFSW
jgi:hypothetical protein